MDQCTEVFTQCMGYEQLTTTNAVKTLTVTKYKVNSNAYQGTITTKEDARLAFVSVDGTAGTNDIRWTMDGTDPTTTLGHLLKAGQNLTIKGLGNIVMFKMIRTSSDAVVNISYFK